MSIFFADILVNGTAALADGGLSEQSFPIHQTKVRQGSSPRATFLPERQIFLDCPVRVF
jgi:hypothetical protein